MHSPAVRRVYLTGFMGAGKTTVGRILASRLAWSFYDIDALIEAQHNASVAALFALHGEQAFRVMEQEAIRSVHQSDEAVISLGGGALETADVRSLVHASPTSHVVFLDAPLPLLVDRCLAQDGGQGRPILQQRAQLENRYNFRLAYYREAHHTVATQSLSPEEVAATIVDYLAALHDGNHSPQPFSPR